MKELLIGNAPCSWGTLEHQDTSQQVPFDRMLDELVETGYTGTELGDWGYMPTDPATLRNEVTKRNLVMLGAFVPVAMKYPRGSRRRRCHCGKDRASACRCSIRTGAVSGSRR